MLNRKWQMEMVASFVLLLHVCVVYIYSSAVYAIGRDYSCNNNNPTILLLFQVTFSPTLSGSYESEVRIYASFMVSTRHGPSMPPTASITLRAVAEQPQLELYPKQPHNSRNSASCNVLDYGVMVGGSIMRGSFELINKGRAELPLEVTIDNVSL